MSSSSGWTLWLVLSSVVSVPGSQLRLCVSVSPALCSCSPRVLVCSHASVSWKGCFLGRERRNHSLEILELRLLSHTSLAHELTLAWEIQWIGCSSMCLLSLSLWGTFQRSPTQTLTQVVCSTFPTAHTIRYNPRSLIGPAGWWQAPTDPNNGCLCRICWLCSAPDPSTATTEDSAEGKKQLVIWELCKPDRCESDCMSTQTAAASYMSWQWPWDLKIDRLSQEEYSSQGKWAMYNSVRVSRRE